MERDMDRDGEVVRWRERWRENEGARDGERDMERDVVIVRWRDGERDLKTYGECGGERWRERG